MKRLLPLLLCALLLAGGCSSNQTAEDDGKLHILTTTYPVYLLTTAVTEGADDVKVTRLITGEVSCLHDYTLTVTDMKAIEQADVIILNGAGLEDFMSDALAQSDAVVIDCSEGLELLPAPGHEGHSHETEYDPHIWMDPSYAMAMMDSIAAALEDITGDSGYRDRCEANREQLLALSQTWEGVFDGQPLITFHDGFHYFSRAFNLNLLKAIEEEEGAETSAAEIKEIVSLVEEYQIPAIFTEKNGSDSTAQAIARETGAAVYQLDMIMSGDGSGLQPYLDAMNANLDTIFQALGGN